jgi:hypothetical protein
MGPLYTSQMTEGQLQKAGIAFGNSTDTGFHSVGSHV